MPTRQNSSTLQRVIRASAALETNWGDGYREQLTQRGVLLPTPEHISKHFVEHLATLSRDYSLQEFVAAIAPSAPSAPRRNPGRPAVDTPSVQPSRLRTLQPRDLVIFKTLAPRRSREAGEAGEAGDAGEVGEPPAKRARLGQSRDSTPPSPEVARGIDDDSNLARDPATDEHEHDHDHEHEHDHATETTVLAATPPRTSLPRSSPPPSLGARRPSLTQFEDVDDANFDFPAPGDLADDFSHIARQRSIAGDLQDRRLSPLSHANESDHHQFELGAPGHSDAVHGDPDNSVMSNRRPKPLRDLPTAADRFGKHLDADLAKHALIRRKVEALDSEISMLNAPRNIDLSGINQVDREARVKRMREILASEDQLAAQAQKKEEERDGARDEESQQREALKEERKILREMMQQFEAKTKQIDEALGDGDGEDTMAT